MTTSPPPSPPHVLAGGGPASPSGSRGGGTRGLGWRAPLLVGIIVVAAAATAYFVFLRDGTRREGAEGPVPPPRVGVAVFPFAAADAAEPVTWYGLAVSEFLYLALEEQPSLRVLTPERLHDLEESMPDSGREALARVGGADYYLKGEVTGNEESVTLTGVWVEAGTGSELNRWILEGITPENLGQNLDDLYGRIREALGLPAPAPSEPPLASLVPIRSAPTRSYVEAAARLAEGDADGCLQRLEEAFELTDFHLAQYLKAVAAARTGYRVAVQEAVRHLSKLARPMPIRVRLFTPALSALHDSADVRSAILPLESLLARFPDEKFPLVWLGGIELYRMGESSRAVDYLQRALSLDPTDPQILQLLGRAELLSGQPEQAAQHLEASWAARPEDSELRLELSRALRAAGRNRQAWAHLEAMRAEEPEKIPVVEGMGHLLLSERRVEEAHDLYQGLRESSDPLVRAQGEVLDGRVYLLEGRIWEGIERYRKAIELAEEQGEPAAQAHHLLELGEVLSALGRHEEALTTFGQVRELEVRAEPDLAMIVVMVNQGSFEDARKMFDNQMQRWQGRVSPAVLGRLKDSFEGTIALEEGRYPEAIAYLEAALPPRTGEGPPEFEALGRAYLGAGDAERAEAVFERIVKDPDRFGRPIRFIQALIRLGEAREAKGEPDTALQAYQEALRWWGTSQATLPELQQAKEALKRLGR